MPKTIRYFFAGLGAILAFTTSYPALAQAQGCETIDTTANQIVIPDSFTTEGDIATGLLQGSTRFTIDVQSITRITGTVAPPVEPMTFSYTGDMLIATATGSLLLRGTGIFERIPTGRGTLLAQVTDGTDRFSTASGYLYVNFVSDDTNNVTSTIEGQICLAPEADMPPPAVTLPQPVPPPPPGSPPPPRPLLIGE